MNGFFTWRRAHKGRTYLVYRQAIAFLVFFASFPGVFYLCGAVEKWPPNIAVVFVTSVWLGTIYLAGRFSEKDSKPIPGSFRDS